MPNNCSTLIQRKQNILHKILRSNSDGKLQNAVEETTAELCVAGTRKTPAYSPSSAHHLNRAAVNARRSNLFSGNRIQPSSDHLYDTHLPSIRDTNGHVDRHDRFHSHSHPKTPVTSPSSKGVSRAPSTSISSIFNALTKRSSENLMNTYDDYEETINHNPVPPSRRSQRPHKVNEMNQNTTKLLPQKPSGDSGIDIHYSTSSADANQQQRALAMSTRLRTNAPYMHVESLQTQETGTKERTGFSPLYQRRQNSSIKAPTKQKIDKYRRRSEEVTQAVNGNTHTNNGLTITPPIITTLPATRSRPPSTFPTAAVRRVSSHGEIQSVGVVHLSIDTNLLQTDQQVQSQSYHHSRNRVKSPYVYPSHHQTKPTTPASNLQTPPVRLRRSHGVTQPASSVNSAQHPPMNKNTNRRYQPHNSEKQSINPSPGNLYLAFIASRHLSNLEDALFSYDIDHQKLLRIFTWLKGVEDYRHQQSNHDQLLIEQNQRMLSDEENLSLYSEIQHAVDDLPANTTGQPCEKIVTMQFEP